MKTGLREKTCSQHSFYCDHFSWLGNDSSIYYAQNKSWCPAVNWFGTAWALVNWLSSCQLLCRRYRTVCCVWCDLSSSPWSYHPGAWTLWCVFPVMRMRVMRFFTAYTFLLKSYFSYAFSMSAILLFATPAANLSSQSFSGSHCLTCV